MEVPFFKEISKAKSVLIVGAGGGFDVVSGIPLYMHFRQLGLKVVLANLSFTELAFSESKQVFDGVYKITKDASDLPYFPEKYILDWLATKGESPAMYALSNEMGVQPLSQAYAYIIDTHHIDTLVLVDGGTDSLMFGDEPKVGTIVEDACSILAASKQSVERNYLAAIGFGVEHTLNHHSCLENISTLIKGAGYLGALSLTKEMSEGEAYLELVDYLNDAMRLHASIVTNSVASAMQGEFGDFHSTRRTKGSVQFISALMSMFWFFQTESISSRLKFASLVESSTTMYQVAKEVQMYRIKTKKRTYKNIPLK